MDAIAPGAEESTKRVAAGTAALSVWCGAVAAIAVAVRVALADHGEGLAAGARWLGALALAAALAAVVWRAAGRSSVWLHRVLPVLLLGTTVALTARWSAERGATKQRDAEVFSLIAAMHKAAAQDVEPLMAEAERAALGASTPVRLYAEKVVETRRETRRRVASYEAAGARVDEAGVLDMSKVASTQDLDERIALLRAYAAESLALLAHTRDVRDNLDRELQIVVRRPQVLDDPRDDKGEARSRLVEQIREAEALWAEACVDELVVLRDTWGAWEAPAGRVTYKDDAARGRYQAAALRAHRAGAELDRRNAELGVLDVTVSKTSVPEARSSFSTRRRPIDPANARGPSAPPQVPPAHVLDRIRYPSPAGDLAAYVTPDPKDGKRHPAVLWAHGGFDGIGSYLWLPVPPAIDQSARAFREAGLVLMIPSFRGENGNPGSFEMFYGEVDDLNAAADRLASLPYVDPERIYLAGHSAGGTLVLLAAAASDRFRASFSFGGIPKIDALAKARADTPFDPASADELRLRSPVTFAGAIRRPTFYFEGLDAADVTTLRRMEALAGKAGAPLQIHLVHGAGHFDILTPLTRLVARKIVEDERGAAPIRITEDEVDQAFAAQGG
jgi:dienelactone hydrolase